MFGGFSGVGETEHAAAVSFQQTDWVIGSELNRQTLVSNTGKWVEVPLRSLLEQISRHRMIPIFIDRRVDPSTPVTLAAKDLTWDQLLYQIGQPYGYSFCRIENIYYFGPVEAAMTLSANFEKLNRWIKDNRKSAKVNWRRPIRCQWPVLTQPRELFESTLKPFDVEIFELESILFDVWPAADLSQVPLVLRVALIAVGFDKWVSVSKSGSKVKIVEYPREEAYIRLVGIENVDKAVKKLKADSSQVEISKLDKRKLQITGSAKAVHVALGQAVSYQVAVKNENAESTFTAQLEGKRGSIVATMAQQLELEMDFPQELNAILNEHVEFEVKEATADQILVLALEGTSIESVSYTHLTLPTIYSV